MKYYLDTEFHEYKKSGINTIELISIGIVDADGREYYAVSNEFDLKAAWKNEWLRENVLKPIFDELNRDMSPYYKTHHWKLTSIFSIKNLKRLIKWKGKSNSEIAEEIVKFTGKTPVEKWEYSIHNNFHRFCLGTDEVVQINRDLTPSKIEAIIEAQNFIDKGNKKRGDKTEFYAYYADYDWVVFCWLFGRMIDLPKVFPMYCIDLKQILDEKQERRNSLKLTIDNSKGALKKHEEHKLVFPLNIKEHEKYPKQKNEHNALDDARWNKELHEFLQTI